MGNEDIKPQYAQSSLRVKVNVFPLSPDAESGSRVKTPNLKNSQRKRWSGWGSRKLRLRLVFSTPRRLCTKSIANIKQSIDQQNRGYTYLETFSMNVMHTEWHTAHNVLHSWSYYAEMVPTHLIQCKMLLNSLMIWCRKD